MREFINEVQFETHITLKGPVGPTRVRKRSKKRAKIAHKFLQLAYLFLTLWVLWMGGWFVLNSLVSFMKETDYKYDFTNFIWPVQDMRDGLFE